MMMNAYRDRLDSKLKVKPDSVYLKYLDLNFVTADLDSTICVQIPDYCDPEMIPTMMACVQSAANPDRIHFSVCYQGDDEDELRKIQDFANCKVVHFAKKDAPGLCAARYECTKMTDDVDFVFHIDSHMRFAEFWDVAILQQWHDCNDSDAILSSYGINYKDTMNDIVSDDRLPVDYNGQYINAYMFEGNAGNGKLRFLPRYKFGKSYKPRKSPFIGGHCTFLPMHVDKIVPSDPGMWFIADEISMAVRYWTHGYNIYQFGIRFIYHLFDRINVTQSKYGKYARFNRDEIVAAKRKTEIGRLRKLFRIDADSNIDLGDFDLGDVRTIDDYQDFAGVNFKNEIITYYSAKKAFDEPHSIDDYAHVDWSDRAAAFNKKYGDCEKYKNLTIAVMLYAFRTGNDVVDFIKDLSKTAAYPYRLHFYVAYTDIDPFIIDSLRSDVRYNVSFIEIPEYKGLSYVHHVFDSMYNGETYVAYFESMVAPKCNWDAYYVNILNTLGRKSFVSEHLSSVVKNCATVLGASHIVNNGIFMYFNYVKDVPCVRGAYISHDFMFIRGESIIDCPHDPYISGSCETLSYSVRLWTHGYDLYSTNDIHFSSKRGLFLFDDVSDSDRDRAIDFRKSGACRMNKLYRVSDSDVELGKFGFGDERTLASFEKYAGICIRDRKLSLNAVFGRFGLDNHDVFSQMFDIKKLRDTIVHRNESVAGFFSKLQPYVRFSGNQSEILNVFADYGVSVKFDDVDSLKMMPESTSMRMRSFCSIEDSLKIMFKGAALHEALRIAESVLSDRVLSAGDKFSSADGGIYFNVDDARKFDNGKPLLAISRFDINGVLTIRTDDVECAWRRFASKILQRSNARTVLITGSDGKTTTTNIVSEILRLDCHGDERFMNSIKTGNGLIGFDKDVGVDFSDVKYYVKEFGVGGSTSILTKFSKQLCPDVSVLINIGDSCHSARFRDRQDVFDTKIRCKDGLKSDGVFVVNKDDDMLSALECDCKIVTFGINDKSADYTCDNIEEENDCIKFTVICPDRKIENVVMNVHGLHNLYGALAGVAVADIFGVDDDKIRNGLANFKYDGERQTIYKAYKNNTIIYDCFGCSVESDVTMLKSLMSIKVPDGARHIAFLGHMATTGFRAEELHRKLAKIIASDFDLDLLICYGGKSKYFCDEYTKAGKNAIFFNDDIEAMCHIRSELREGDAILVKGCGSYKFGSLFKNNIENDSLLLPEYEGRYADNNDFHGVSKSMLCRSIDTGDIYLSKYSTVSRLGYHVSMIFVIVALCDMYKDRMDDSVVVDSSVRGLLRKYYVHSSISNESVSVDFKSGNKYSVRVLLKVALDYIALDVIYSLIEHIGRDVFSNYFNAFLKQIGCADTIIVDPQSRDIKDNCTTADDVYKVLKYFVALPCFESIVNVDSGEFVSDNMLSQKSKLLRIDESDEEDTYCDNVVFAKKVYSLSHSSCIAVAKVDDEYLACVALDRAVVYKNHAPDVDVSRMIKTYVNIKKDLI